MIIKEFIPPAILNYVKGFFYGWSGNYSTWDEAKSKSAGYDTDVIFQKVRSSLLKVKNGEAVYERDSVLFPSIQYSFPLLSALFYVALKNDSKLNVLDFGGSMGSSYFQNRKLLTGLKEFNWCVVEQPHFVKEGQMTFADDHLRFYQNIDQCLKEVKVNALLLSSVIQYLENPHHFLDEVVAKQFDYIIIDRAPMLKDAKDRITIQQVPRNIYDARYPCWLLNEKGVLDHFVPGYEIVYNQETEEKINVRNTAFKAVFLKRKGI